MKVQLYAGSLRLVEKSGVGRAVHHQQEMLRSVGIETTFQSERDARIIHINTVFPDAVLAALRARLGGKKVIWYGHSTMEDFKNSFRGSNLAAPLFRRWITLCYSLGDVVITPTEYSKSLLSGYGIKKEIYVLSNGVETDFFCRRKEYAERFRKRYRLGAGQKVVMSVGHYMERKGILDFIELAKAMPEARFFWFGYTNPHLIPGHVREAMRRAPDNLCFAGYADREALRDAYCGSDLFCFMSHEETEGIVVLEALACGIPVVLRDIPVYQGWLSHGRNVYKCGSPDDFQKTVTGVLSGDLPSLAEEGRRMAMQRSMHETGRALRAVYQNVMKHSICVR